MTVNRKAFMWLSAVLVALNISFWLVPGALALPKAFVADLFGQRLIRAEVLVQGGGGATDYRIDRGVVVSANATQVTLREANGDVVPIAVAPDVRIQGGGRQVKTAASLGRRQFRVTVIRVANAPASQIQIEP